MAEIFGNTDNIRGCFKAFLLNAQASHGAVLKMPNAGDYPSSFSDPYLVTGFSAAQVESLSFTRVFGGRVYTYAFGHDPTASWLNVDLMGFLVDGSGYSNVVEKLNSAYFTERVTVSQSYAKLGLGMGNVPPMRGFITGISTQTADPQHSLQQFTIRLALVEVQ
jgi:hypothetical protein